MAGLILCYGDSNTYGYDPRSYLGGRYPDSVRWTSLLKKYGWEESRWEESRKILLVAPPPMAPGTWVQDEQTIAVSRCLAPCYEDTAQMLKINFADAGSWGIDLAFDGVHFSETGHLAFAKGIQQAMSSLFPG